MDPAPTSPTRHDQTLGSILQMRDRGVRWENRQSDQREGRWIEKQEYVNEEDGEDGHGDNSPSEYRRITRVQRDFRKKGCAFDLTVATRSLAMGIHAHISDPHHKRIKSIKRHVAAAVDVSLDMTTDFIR
ncbi:hypothetical protein D9619_000160 [Psilocybe cf. subviscida]|uniref:Uncharacterized protein n=1 Tax=Psilocybe cf. subviscida TaxID=2480587 RepID=A0A8H5F454_9AGAR|nr:hypothetical protein D9619_000160 [Psilocybe cf. subviscida]